MIASTRRARTTLLLQRRHRRVLYIVAKLHYLSVHEAGRALGYAPASYEWVRKTMHELWRQRYLARQVLPREARAGSSPYVYRLDRNGYAILRAHQEMLGLSLPNRFRDRPASPLLLAHDAAINRFLIAGMALARHDPALFIRRFEHDRSLRGTIRVRQPGGGSVTLNVDGFLEFIYRSRWLYPLILECDRNHHEVERWREKIRKLVSYITDNVHEERFGTRGLTIPCFVDGGAAGRVDQLLAWTESELNRLQARETAQHFLFAGLRQDDSPQRIFLAPIWRQPFAPAPARLLPIQPAGS